MNEQEILRQLNQLRAELKVVSASKREPGYRQTNMLAEIGKLEEQLAKIRNPPKGDGSVVEAKGTDGKTKIKLNRNSDGTYTREGTQDKFRLNKEGRPIPVPNSYPNAQFLHPETATGVINHFGAQAPTPTAGGGKGKGGGKGQGNPPAPDPAGQKNVAAQLLAGLPTQDQNVGQPVDGKPINRPVSPETLATVAGIKQQPILPKKEDTTPPPNNRMNWQSYLGLGTDLLSGGIAMAMANKPLTPFKQPQAYDTMMQEVTQRRNEGLPAEQRAMANQRTQNQYSTDVGALSRIANGSAGIYMAGLQGASANAQNAQLATSALDQQIRQQNQQVFNSAALQDMNREQAAYGQLRQEEMAARNAYAQAGAANFQQAGARIDYINQYENPDSFYNLLRKNMTEQISGWGSYLRQPIRP